MVIIVAERGIEYNLPRLEHSGDFVEMPFKAATDVDVFDWQGEFAAVRVPCRVRQHDIIAIVEKD